MNQEQKTAKPGDFSTTTTTRPCWALLPDHKHCLHGHVEDCTDSDNCELVD